jgi:hypothetical protein
LGFNGEPRDLLTGHYLLGNGYRAFNPVLMRFNSRTAGVHSDDGGLNSCMGIVWVTRLIGDPTGHSILLKSLMMFTEKRATPLGSLQSFAGTPHVLEKIAGNLSGPDLEFSRPQR